MRGWGGLRSLALLPLLCLPNAVVASPHCHGCAEGSEAIARAMRAFVGQVVAFDDNTWTYEVLVEEVFLGDVGEPRITLAPHPMSSCHPKSMELGSRWLVLAGDSARLPTCSRALVELDTDDSAELLASLEPPLADHDRWASASADALAAEFTGSGTETREAIQDRVATRSDPEAELFWVRHMTIDPSRVLMTPAIDGLVQAASDETLAKLLGNLGYHPFSDEIILRALERRRPVGTAAQLELAYADDQLPPQVKRSMLPVFEAVGLPTATALGLLAGDETERGTALRVMTHAPDPGCLDAVVSLAIAGDVRADEALILGYLRLTETRAAGVLALSEALQSGAQVSPVVMAILCEAPGPAGDIESYEASRTVLERSCPEAAEPPVEPRTTPVVRQNSIPGRQC